jgi:hypothetical protein
LYNKDEKGKNQNNQEKEVWIKNRENKKKSRWRARLSAPVQSGPGIHPASYTVGTGSFPGVKRQGRGVNHPPASSAEVKERVELHM